MTLLIATLIAQVLTATVAPDKPFTVGWEYPAPTGYSFRLWCNDTIIRNFTATDITLGELDVKTGRWPYTATVPGLPAGTHDCRISAYVEGMPEAYSERLQIPSGVPSPQNFRLIVTIDVKK